MAIFEGVVSGLGSIADKLGFDFVTGNIPLAPPAPVFVGIQVPEFNDGQFSSGFKNHVGGFFLDIPNHSTEFGGIAINMAQEALVLIELAVALQMITDPKGGIKIKDALDPYHFNVIKNALEENGDPVPQPTNPGATTLTKLGGAITETGALSAIAAGADAMKLAGFGSDFLKLTPQIMPFGLAGGFGLGPITFAGGAGSIVDFQVAGAFPNYSFALSIMNSAVVIKTIILQYIVGLFRNSIDTEAGALLLKNVLDDFSVAVSKNAIEKTGKQAPNDTVQEGQSGIF